jgi:hypothetical protein
MQLKFVTRLACLQLFFWHGSVGRIRDCAGAWIREASEQAEPHFEYGLRGLAAYRFLCADDAEQALSEWSLAQQRFPDHGALQHPTWGMVIGLYAGRMDVAADALARARRTFWRADAFSSQSWSLHLWAAGAVAAARMVAGDRGVRPRLALGWAIAGLRIQRARTAAPMLQHLLAARELLRGRRSAGLVHLEGARAHYAELGLRLFAASAQHALARIHPDEHERQRHSAAARAIFETEGIVRPERWARALLPGLPDA